ncbi:hypothetical protein ACH436_05950 [Isoptericola sp. NPDC019693]|uniref:hypothetical protein n=1 Tax=Isoptericola sp. NPDC019693 TaxID=3364009 RepID=UPI003795139B
MARSYSDRTLKQLFIMSGHHCAHPECTTRTVEYTDDGPEILGDIAHIEASSDNGPRRNLSLAPRERDGYANLLVLCAHHHRLVDRLDSEYPVEELREWKRQAERETREKLAAGATQISFAELEMVCNAFVDGDVEYPSTPMLAAPPQEKMRANGLTNAIRPQMSIGLAQAPQAAEYIARQAQLSSKFPGRLLQGFATRYDALRESGIEGDALFLELIEYGTRATSPQITGAERWVFQAAVTAVVCHLFQVCDLFDAP